MLQELETKCETIGVKFGSQITIERIGGSGVSISAVFFHAV
jgi:hypothetical protein